MNTTDQAVLAPEPCRELVERAFRQAGLAADQAAQVADPLIEAELRGRSTHGLIRVAGLVDQIRRGGASPVRIERDGGGWLAVDGGGAIGYLVAQQAVAWAIERAEQHGTCLVAVRHATHCGMLGYYVDRVARAGLVGLMTCNCYPQVVPFGGSQPVFGTNPIAMAAPTEAEPVLVDLSTAAVTIGQLLVAEHRGESIDPSLAFDADGRPTADPAAARTGGGVAAFGGHKGSALALITQILSSSLVGSAVLPGRGADYGYLLAAVDPGVFTDRDTFNSETTRLVDCIRGARPAPGHDAVAVPGDRAWRERQRRLREGIVVDRKLHEQLLALASPAAEA